MYLKTNFTNEIMLLSLVCMGFVASIPTSANALDSQVVSQNLHGQTNQLIAQDRDNRNRDRQFTVYYRNRGDRQWTREDSHTDRREAQRAADKLERRGYKTYVQMSREANRGMMGRDRGMMGGDRDMQRK
jgi:CelD/BcsL family acetyltransferase involved in cellulose biosynthesis